MYNLHQSKSLKKLNEQNTKTTHVFPQSNSQFSKNSSVNLTKLGTYKGKFSLTSKYNSISSQNNNESKYQSKCNESQEHYMSEMNKENVARMSNVISYDFSRERDSQFQKNSKFVKNLSNYQEQEESQNMKEIMKVASSLNFQNSLPKQNPATKTKTNNDKNSSNNIKSTSLKPQSNVQAKSKTNENAPIIQRRSKFHKYDNKTDENEFLVIEEEQKNHQSKQSLQKRVLNHQLTQKNLLKKCNPNKIHTQTIKLSQLNVEKRIQDIRTQLQSYQQCIKHITYSMIKIISLISKISNSNHSISQNENRNIKIMSHIKNEIFIIYNKELNKYIDKLKIREELIQMARKEQQFMQQQSLSMVSEHQSAITTSKQHLKQQQIDIHSQNSSCSNVSISHQKHSCLSESSHNSQLHEYYIKEASEYPSLQQSGDSLDQEVEKFDKSDFFNFDSIKELEILPSGRNLLETFNNQHLCNQLENIGKQVREKLQEEDVNEDLIQDNKQLKTGSIESSEVISPETIEIYEQNFIKALKKIHLQQPQILQQQNSQPHNICRKLFNQQQQSSPLNLYLDHSPISRLKNHQFSHNQTQQEILQSEHYYEVISNLQLFHEESSNYLKLLKGDRVKLLRKVDNSRWIAELEDKIGFVEEVNIVRRVKCIGVTAQKDLTKSNRQ